MIFSKKIGSLATCFCTLFLWANIVSANDPNLIGHWTFDEGSGLVAADVISGNNGTLMKGAYNPSMTGSWVAGKLGGAFNFDGTTTCSVPVAAVASIDNEVTVAFWAKGNSDMPLYGLAFQAYGANSHLEASMIAFSGSNPCTVFVAGQGYPDQYYLLLEAGTYEESWHHFAYVKNSTNGEIKIYLDGALAANTGEKTTPINTGDIYKFDIGAGIYGSSPYHGAIDDFRIYKRALTEQEILTLSKLTYNEKAYDPNPGDGTANVSYKPLLEWLPGIYATSHDIYLGNDYNAVNEASKLTGDVNGDGQVDWLDLSMMADQWLSPSVSGLSADLNDDGNIDNVDFAIMAANYKNSGNGIYKGHQTLNALRYTPGTLQLGETYYWRIDEVDGTNTWKGDIWSFTVAEVPMLPGAEIETEYLRYVISPNGDNDGFINKQTGVNYCVPSKFAILFKGGTGYSASTVSSRPETGQMTVQFGTSGISAVIDVVQTNDYFTLEVNSVSDPDVDSFSFVNIPLINGGTLEDVFPGCVLALNLQTNVVKMPGSMSSLVATAYKRFGIVEGKAAVIGCPKDHLREAMKSVVADAHVTDGLPKSTCGGPWAMDDPNSYGSYVFNYYGISNTAVNDWIDLCDTLGIYQINIYSAFRYGDYLPSQSVYPGGFSDVKAVTDVLHAAGIKVGLHTMAYYIDKGCPWVTPVPDPRLDFDVNIPLTSSITSTATSIPITATASEKTILQNGMTAGTVTIRIENELLTFSGISGSEPSYSLTGCSRGALGTTKASHAANVRAYHLKEEMGMFVPNGDSTLLAEVAAKTADAFNQGGFDMLYLDGLNGEGIFAGWDVAWHYGSKFAWEVANRLNKPALMEMSIFHHHLWYLRSRMGAWDVSSRGHKAYIDRHILCNEQAVGMLASSANLNMFMPQHLGWFRAVPWSPPQDEVTFPDVIEYLCGKCIGHDASLSMMEFAPGSITAFKGRLADIIKNYETLRLANYFPQSVKDQLKVLGHEFTLKQNPISSQWEFYPIQYFRHKVLGLDGSSNVWTVTNNFDTQPVKLRIEALSGTGSYEAGGNPVLASFNPVDFTEMTNTIGITSSLVSDPSIVHSPYTVSGKFTAANTSVVKTAAWANAGKIFSPVKNLNSYKGMGLWIYGDGKGEILNIQVRDGDAFGSPIAEHYVDIDFTGWKYIELVESESDRYWDYSWPYGWEYTIQFLWVDYSKIKYLNMYYNNIAPGETVTCYLTPVKAVPLTTLTITNPQITIGDSTITFPCSLSSGSYLEFHALSDCKLYNSNGDWVGSILPIGTVPTLETGDNPVVFDCSFSGGQNARARVTLISQDADPIQ